MADTGIIRTTMFPARRSGAPLVVLAAGADEGGAVREAVRALTDQDFSLLAVEYPNWNDDLTPWPAPPAFRGGEPFGGAADETLRRLAGALLPEAEADLAEQPAYRLIAGYSLGGLFALYALYRTELFARAASASGSVWYPGFLEYVKTHAMPRTPDALYLSLGEREGGGRNVMMRPVAENMRALAQWYGQSGIPTILEMNPGGHFDDEIPRTAKAVAWTLDR